uniref:Uncharacterized protein n=1 Tax=Astyanax mexicanus TaxID=7994 RepID=A0A3B1J589_ASTMX
MFYRLGLSTMCPGWPQTRAQSDPLPQASQVQGYRHEPPHEAPNHLFCFLRWSLPGPHGKTKHTKIRNGGTEPVIPAIWEAEAGELLEPGRRRLQWEAESHSTTSPQPGRERAAISNK